MTHNNIKLKETLRMEKCSLQSSRLNLVLRKTLTLDLDRTGCLPFCHGSNKIHGLDGYLVLILLSKVLINCKQ